MIKIYDYINQQIDKAYSDNKESTINYKVGSDENGWQNVKVIVTITNEKGQKQINVDVHQ